MRFLAASRVPFIIAALSAIACNQKTPEQDVRRDTVASASETGFDRSVLVSDSAGVKCYELARYVVVEKARSPDVGSDIFVRPKTDTSSTSGPASQRCAADSLAGDYAVRNADAEHFMGMRNGWLFLDSGTGPERAIVLHDLGKRSRVTSVGGDVAGWRDSVTMLIWVNKGEQPRENCPDTPESLAAGLDSLFALDLRTASLTPVGRVRCSERQ